MYTLGELETIQCHKCGILCHGGSDMEITVEPDGCTVEIRCENCPGEGDL
jgi:hypothetical protein